MMVAPCRSSRSLKKRDSKVISVKHDGKEVTVKVE